MNSAVIVITISTVVLIIALNNWRNGLLALLVVGVLQDALRKLTPGVPTSYVLWSAAIFAVILVLALMNKAIKNTRPLNLGSATLRNAWMAFFILIALQSMNTLVRWGSLPLVVLGLVFYLAPVAALLVSIAYAKSERQMLKFIKTYVFIMVPAALTVYLSPGYSDAWPLLRDVGSFGGKELIIYDIGQALKSHPGIFRVGEIAAWHATTAACFMIILLRKHPSQFFKIVVAVLILLMIGAIILTGRRKMLMAFSIFLFVQWGLLARYSRGGGRLTLAIMIIGLFGSFAFVLLEDPNVGNAYVQRGKTVFEDTGERLLLSYRLMESAFYRSEWVGLGAGVTSQGASHVSVNTGAGGAAEAGTGKIVVELGVPGALVIVWFLFALGRRILTVFRQLARTDEALLYYAVSFFAVLVANLATFLVATQLYSDPFVLIILGLVAGFLFSVCRVGGTRYQGGLKGRAAMPVRVRRGVAG